MSERLIKDARKILDGESGPLEDQELEYLAKEITKLGFKVEFARAYAVGPSMIEALTNELERKEKTIQDIRKLIGPH